MKVFLRYIGRSSYDTYKGIAVDENGKILCEHYSSTLNFLRFDLKNKSSIHNKGYEIFDEIPDNEATIEQNKPNGTGADIVDLVISDLKDRSEVGLKKYGQKLKAFNGRNALIDAYQESMDLTQYLKQKIIEDESKANVYENNVMKLIEKVDNMHTTITEIKTKNVMFESLLEELSKITKFSDGDRIKL